MDPYGNKIQREFLVVVSVGILKILDSVTEDDLFNYKAQRWLWNERDQLQRRYLRFDLKALIKVVEDAAGSGSTCAEISKLPEGNFNKTFLVTMQNRHQVIARLPNPNAGRSHYTIASEVATMDYMRDRLKIPVPKVLAYSTRASTNSVGAEYIVMEKCPGIELGRVWDDLPGKKRIEVVRQLAGFTARLSKASSPAYGSLYYSKDISDVDSKPVDDTFSVGPTISRTWFDGKRAEVDVHRGPWSSAEEVVNTIINREVACIFNGPGGFPPSKSSKMSVIEAVRRIVPFIIPTDDAYPASIPWHNDLHSDNIFVNPDQTTEVTGIIDWQGVHVSPAFLHVHDPSLIEYDGPVLDVFEQPQLPSGFAELDPVAKKAARELHTAQSIWDLYQIFTQKQAPDLLRTLRYRDTLPCQIMTIVGSIFDDGETYVQSLLSELATTDIWNKVVRSDVPCPLAYSEDQLSKQKDELAKWERDIELKAGVIAEVGAYTGWDGAVSPEDFDTLYQRLEEAKKNFLKQEMESGLGSLNEREQWEKAWPFQNDNRQISS
ncbi:MAG: hypothetical protein Q9165_003562 [Trypethelium subeluteriae]